MFNLELNIFTLRYITTTTTFLDVLTAIVVSNIVGEAPVVSLTITYSWSVININLVVPGSLQARLTSHSLSAFHIWIVSH